MNFLAHIYLSGISDEIKIGNLLGELVKGNLDNPRNEGFSLGVKKGISLHRSIDYFTDNHLIVRKSVAKIRPLQGRFSGICLDILYDYFLASKFDLYTSKPLAQFSEEFYELLTDKMDTLPHQILPMVNSMISRDWFGMYAKQDGIRWAFLGMSKRIKTENRLLYFFDEILPNINEFENDFSIFFDELITFCEIQIGQKLRI